MKINRTLSVLLSVLLILAVLIPCTGTIAFAAASPGIVFDCLYSPSHSKLTITASVSNPDTDVNTAMFVLDYDKSLLTTAESKVSIVSPASKSAVYYSEGHIGADWYYNDGLAKSSSASPAVTIEFTVKDGTSLEALKSALSICANTDYLNSIGGYGVDGGLLLCKSSSEFYNAAQSTATSKFNFSEEQTATVKPKLFFDSIYSADKKELVTTVSVSNPDNKVGSAMFVLKYDSSKLTPKASGSVSYLGSAKESRTYTNSASGYLGADWYYDTALPASGTPTDAVQLVFDVTDGATLEQLKNALSVCTDTSYLDSISYKDDGGILICESGNVFFNAATSTAEAVFSYDEAEPSTYTITVTDGTAKVGSQTVTSAKAGDTVTITANAPANGYKFKEWQIISGSPSLASAVSATTTFTMPAANVSLKAVYEPDTPAPATYSVSVADGTATVGNQTVTSAKAGDTVTITAKTPSAGYKFKEWQIVSGSFTLASATSATTTFTMPAANVSLKAVYEPATTPAPSTYTITVKNGTAKVNGQNVSSAKAGDVVTITANSTDLYGNAFKNWVVNSGKITLANSGSATTTFTMPASNVSVTAKYDTGKGPLYQTGDNATTIYAASAAVVLVVSIFVIVVLLYRKRH